MKDNIFPIKSGKRQGYLFSPLLLNSAIQWISLNLIRKFCDFEQNNVYQNQFHHRLPDNNQDLSSYSISPTLQQNNAEQNDLIWGHTSLETLVTALEQEEIKST